MNKRKIQLYAVSIVLVALVFMSPMGLTANATLKAPKMILADTPVGSNPFIEGLELIASQGSSLITQYYQFGGQKYFPLDHTTAPFDDLELMYIISSNQENWRNYWPRTIWEFRDGATVVFQFSQGLTESIADADTIAANLNTWMGTTLDILYGVEVGGQTTLYYWGYMDSAAHSTFITNEFYSLFNSGGYTNFITNQVISSSPVSVVGTGLVWNGTVFNPLAVAAFVHENGITISGDTHNLSIRTAFGYSGSIMPSPDSAISGINFQLPFVGTVHDYYPETNNLYPDLVGKFEWTMKFGSWIDNSYDDMYVTFSTDASGLDSFPQITADVSVDIDSLHSPTDPKLNYTIKMTNTGNEKAYNTTFAWDLGDGDPIEQNVSIFDSDTYTFDSDLKQYYNYSSGLLGDELAVSLNKTSNWNQSLEITGWFINKTTGLPVQPVSIWDEADQLWEIDIGPTLLSMYVEKSFFQFEYSSNLATTRINGTFYLIGTIEELTAGNSQEFWWSVGNLPATDDRLIQPAIESRSGGIMNETMPTQYYQTNVTLYEEVNVSLQDWIVEAALNNGSDLRYPPINTEFIPGVMFFYQDAATRKYFGWSNGLIVQIYDEEAVLKTTVSLNATVYEMHEWAEINVTIENIGDAIASDVQIQGFHAQLGSGWELKELKEFSDETYIGTINPGEAVTHTFLRKVETFIGIHPVGIVVDYTTEKADVSGDALGSTNITNLASNLLVALVMPKDDSGKPKQEYPTPVVNVSVTVNDENGGEIENGDLLEVKTEVRNDGDERTTLKIFSYFPTRMGSIDPNAQWYDGKNFKVTDESGNVLTGYDSGFAMDHPDFPITIAAVAGLHLEPGEAIIFYYKINVTDADNFILPPVAVEYDSRYPMPGTSGVEGESGDGGGTSPLISGLNFGMVENTPDKSPRFKISQADSSSTWTSHSSLKTSFTAIVIDDGSTGTNTSSGIPGFTSLTSFMRENLRLMIVVLAGPILVLIIRERRRKN